MLIVGVVAGATSYMTSRLDQLTSMQKVQTMKSEVANIERTLQNAMSRATTCRLEVASDLSQGLPMGSSLAVKQVTYGPGSNNTILKTGLAFGQTAATIGEVTLESLAPTDSSNQFYGKLKIAPSAQDIKNLGMQPAVVDLVLEVSGTVALCRASSGDMASVCAAMGRTYNPANQRCRPPQIPAYEVTSRINNGGVPCNQTPPAGMTLVDYSPFVVGPTHADACLWRPAAQEVSTAQ